MAVFKIWLRLDKNMWIGEVRYKAKDKKEITKS